MPGFIPATAARKVCWAILLSISLFAHADIDSFASLWYGVNGCRPSIGFVSEDAIRDIVCIRFLQSGWDRRSRFPLTFPSGSPILFTGGEAGPVSDVSTWPLAVVACVTPFFVPVGAHHTVAFVNASNTCRHDLPGVQILVFAHAGIDSFASLWYLVFGDGRWVLPESLLR